MSGLSFTLDPVTSDEVLALIATHLKQMRSQSPACSVHAMDVSGLQGPDMRFWSVWESDALVGCGALKRLSETEGEIKSMHVLAVHRGKGYSKAILAHIEAAARESGITRLSLETGSQPEFAPARALYARAGYSTCAPFGDYTDDPNSAFMTREL